MIELDCYKNKHIDEDIYVIGSGKSCDFLPKDFLDNKITIGINQVYNKFKVNYLVRKETSLLKEVIEKNPDTIHFISKGDCGNDNNKNLEIITREYSVNNNIVIFNHNINTHRINSLPEDNCMLVSYSTIVSGIHLAAYMGAKNIILIGHDCCCIDNQPNFAGYHTDKTYKIAHKAGVEGYKEWLKLIENDTVFLRTLLKEKYGCNIVSINPFLNFKLEGHKLS